MYTSGAPRVRARRPRPLGVIRTRARERIRPRAPEQPRSRGYVPRERVAPHVRACREHDRRPDRERARAEAAYSARQPVVPLPDSFT